MNNLITTCCSKGWCNYIAFHSKIITAHTNENIFNVGDETLGIHIINKGKVKVTAHTGGGTERIIRLASEGDLLGHRGFGGSWKYTVSATALDDTELLFIPLSVFNEAVKANPDFAYEMMMFFAEELRESERLASQLPIRNVIASVLYNNLKVFGFAKGSTTMLSYTLSRKDLASQAGTRYETLVRTLADFNHEGLIRIQGKSIHILDSKRLAELKEGR